MGRGAAAWVLVLLGTLGGRPSAAAMPGEPPIVPQPLSLPERAAFDELLFSFANPARSLEEGLSVSSLPLAVRARARAFVTPGGRQEGEVRDVLSFAAQDLPVSALPAGRELALLLDRSGEVEQLRLRDVGPWLRRPSGPLQGMVESLLERFPGGKTAGALSASAAALGLVYQFGTVRAHRLGLEPHVSASMLERRVRASLLLDTEPHFRTFRANLATQLRLPDALQLALPLGRLELLELGVVAARTPEGMLLDAPWARVRGRLASLETTVGVRSGLAGPSPWWDVEAGVQHARFGVRTIVSHHWVSARTYTTATASYHMAWLRSGAFISFDGRRKRAFGVVGMAVF